MTAIVVISGVSQVVLFVDDQDSAKEFRPRWEQLGGAADAWA